MNTIPNDLNPLGKEAEPAVPGQPDLPAGYTRLAFIYGATGTRAHADTLIPPSANIGLYWEHYVSGSGNEQGFSTCSTQGYACFFACSIKRPGLGGYAFGGRYFNFGTRGAAKSEGWLNWLNSKQARLKNSDEDISASLYYGGYEMFTITLGWSRNNYAIFQTTRIYSAKISENDTIIRDFYPVVSPAGEPGFYDILTRTFWPNIQADSAFGCGIETMDELFSLSDNLPAASEVDTNTTIALSLPGEFENDSEVQSYLIKIMAKGWTPNITYRT